MQILAIDDPSAIVVIRRVIVGLLGGIADECRAPVGDLMRVLAIHRPNGVIVVNDIADALLRAHLGDDSDDGSLALVPRTPER